MRQKQIKGLNLEELTSLCTEQGFTPFRAKQIYHWMYRHGVMDISLMNNIPENVKKFLEDNGIPFLCLIVLHPITFIWL